MENKDQIIIYDPHIKGNKALEVKLQDETVWLTQEQMATLFDKGRSTITEHINNIFKEHELEENSVCRDSRRTGSDGKVYNVKHYSLDVIISVGYRVSSLKGTQFRIWATKVLRDHIVNGFTLNEQRLKENMSRLNELQKSIALIEKAEDFKKLTTSEAQGLLQVITEYTKSWILLNQFDQSRLIIQKTIKPRIELTYDDCKNAIKELKASLLKQNEASDLFGSEIEDRFKAIIGNINQSLFDKEVYPTIEEKASHILYFVIKDHPFSDGNKRIGAMLFMYFLNMNMFLYKENGEVKINDNTLIALALLVAVSNPDDKENIIRLITNILS